MIVAQAQQALTVIVRDLEKIDHRLSQIAQAIQSPQFAQDSDEPLNLEAAIFSAIVNTQKDEIAAAIKSLQQITELDHQTLVSSSETSRTLAEIIFSPQEPVNQPEVFS